MFGLYAWMHAEELLDSVADSVIGGEFEPQPGRACHAAGYRRTARRNPRAVAPRSGRLPEGRAAASRRVSIG